jgi:hypothetical protein
VASKPFIFETLPLCHFATFATLPLFLKVASKKEKSGVKINKNVFATAFFEKAVKKWFKI